MMEGEPVSEDCKNYQSKHAHKSSYVALPIAGWKSPCYPTHPNMQNPHKHLVRRLGTSPKYSSQYLSLFQYGTIMPTPTHIVAPQIITPQIRPPVLRRNLLYTQTKATIPLMCEFLGMREQPRIWYILHTM